MRAVALLRQIDPVVRTQDWLVDIQPVGNGRTALTYLAAYVFRVAIGDHRILCLDDGHVTFADRRSGSRRWRCVRLEATEFLRRFLQDVLPCGFQKVRHYGYLSPGSRHRFDTVRWLATLQAGQTFVLQSVAPTAPPPNPIRPHCVDCGGELHFVIVLRRRCRALFDTSYPDGPRFLRPIHFARSYFVPEPRSLALPRGGERAIAGPLAAAWR